MKGSRTLLGIVLALTAAACGAAASPPASKRASSPTVSGSPIASTPASVPVAGGTLVVHAVGDVNLDPDYVSGLRERGFDHAWTGVGDLFARDDLTIVNLECPVAKAGTRQAKRYTFLGSPDALGPMRRAGVEVATLANNHTLDFGLGAMRETIASLRAADIAAAGAGENAADAYRPALLTIRGRRVAIVSLTQVVPGRSWFATEGRAGVASGSDPAAALKAVREASRAADIVIVGIHWGVERSTEPTPAQRAFARRLVEAGADAIFGHHPHVLQPLEHHRGRPIFYSLGNFVWRRSWPESYRTGIAEVRFSPDGRVHAALLPAYLESSGHPVLR